MPALRVYLELAFSLARINPECVFRYMTVPPVYGYTVGKSVSGQRKEVLG
jgi:hypothetical protein